MVEKFRFGYRVINDGMHDFGLDNFSLSQITNWQKGLSPNVKYFICLNSFYLSFLHFAFFDFDCDCEESELATQKEIKLDFINDKMRTFKLDGFIYETYHGYHLVLNDVYTFPRYLHLLSDMGCCNGFASFTHKRGCSSLRLTAKPGRAFDICFLGRINYTRNQSIHPAILEYFDIRALAEQSFNQVIC